MSFTQYVYTMNPLNRQKQYFMPETFYHGIKVKLNGEDISNEIKLFIDIPEHIKLKANDEIELKFFSTEEE